jgi:hypothetical protein
MVTLADLLPDDPNEDKNKKGITLDSVDKKQDTEDKEVGTIRSILSGVASGVFKIPEGVVSLGANLIDLGANTNTAASVEKFFAKINPFDEAAEATAAGKITETIINIGVPGGIAFKAGKTFARNALLAKQNGKYVNLTGDAGQKLLKNIKDGELTTLGKTIEYGAGAGLGGIAEGVFVGDVQEAGTFGNLLGGPTELSKTDEYSAKEALKDRLKFGIEGAAFTGIIGAGAAGIKKLRNQKSGGKVITNKLDNWIDKNISQPLRARGIDPQEIFDIKTGREGKVGKDLNIARNYTYDIDKQLDKLFPFWKRVIGDKTVQTEREVINKELNDVLLSGSGKNKSIEPLFSSIDELDAAGKPTGKKIFNVTFDEMDQSKIDTFKNKLITKFQANTNDVDEIVNTLKDVRSGWGNLFSAAGKRLEKNSLEDFKSLMKEKVPNFLNSSYKIFDDKISKTGFQLANNYAPPKALITETTEQIKNIVKENTNGKIILDNFEAENIVENIWKTSKLPQGFKLKSELSFTGPDFLKSSFLDKTMRQTGEIKFSELTGTTQKVIDKLLGKNENVLSTILQGTNKLSMVVRSNQYFDNLLKKSNEMKIVRANQIDEFMKQGLTKSEAEKKAIAPLFVDNAEEARKIYGGTDKDIAMVGAVKSPRGVEGMQSIDPFYDPDLGIDVVSRGIKQGEAQVAKVINPLEGKWALADTVEALENIKTSFLGDGMAAQLYQNLILYPKATSQLAKTVLGPITHIRNFMSASMFAAANGIMPFADSEAVKQARQAVQIFGRNKEGNQLYQKLLELGVVNSNITVGDLTRLLDDVKFGSTLGQVKIFKKFMNRFNKVQQFAQDAYTAEDDFWKIFTWFGEKDKLMSAYKNAGLNLGDNILDEFGKKTGKIFNEEFLELEAANMVKNQVPNYAYVNNFIKALRQLPVGNFVSFPSEMLRTTTNIVERAINEISYKTMINGQVVNPLRGRGIQRLLGLGITTTAVPYAAVEAGKAIYNVSENEINAMRRYIPQWSKNSTLIPTRDKDGNLEYIDFSHMNAYDTVSRPIQTIINAVQEGRADKDGLMDDFIIGLAESTKELGLPFIGESIWTEALLDVSPVRGGRTADGRGIWNPLDTTGDKIQKALAHLGASQVPLNWKQLERLGFSLMPQDSTYKFDKYGNEFELGNELLGIVGLRNIKVNPERGIEYKLTNYKKGIRNARSLFTTATTKGGPITPEEIVDAYLNSNRALYQVNRELYKDIEAARILGMKNSKIEETMINRGERKAYRAIEENTFKPLTISQDVRQLFEANARELGLGNPFESAYNEIQKLLQQLSKTKLNGDFFPDLENPFSNLPAQPTLNPSGQLPPAVLGADVVSVANSLNQNLVGGVNPQTTQLIQQSNTLDSFIRGR